jgi:hypothetical protein
MTPTLLCERFTQVVTRTNTHAIHEYPLDQRTFADLVTAKLPLAQNAADIVALINAYKVPFATFGNP